MSTLRAILEMQGCLDTAVVVTQDPRVMEIVDAFLPDSSANSQWYQEIEAFMFRPGGDAGHSVVWLEFTGELGLWNPPRSDQPKRPVDDESRHIALFVQPHGAGAGFPHPISVIQAVGFQE